MTYMSDDRAGPSDNDRRAGSTYDPMACDHTRQYFAWPGRRIVELTRRVNALHGNGLASSICAMDYAPFLREFAARISRQLCRE